MDSSVVALERGRIAEVVIAEPNDFNWNGVGG